MKIIILILSFTYAYGQTDSITGWQTIRVLVGCADTTWRTGEFHAVQNTDNKIEIQFRSNGAIIQQRKKYIKR